MKRNRARLLTRVLLLLPALLLLIGADRPEGSTEAMIPELSERINAFTLDFLKVVAKEDSDNAIFSPQSIFHGLAMSYIASGGETRKELAKALHFPDDDKQLMVDLSKLRQQLQSAAKEGVIDVSIANAAWLDQRHAKFTDEFTQNLTKGFGAPVQAIDFQDGQGASAQINKWVSEKTHDKIRNVLGPADLVSKSKPDVDVVDEPALVTVNAVYYKAQWASRFGKSETEELLFHPRAGATEKAMFMHQLSLLPYAENADFKFLEMPYVGGHYSMYVLLPNGILTANKLVSLLKSETIIELKRKSFPHEVDVLFPKFEMASHCDAKDVLSKMGVTAAFNSKRANFDRMIVKNINAFRIYLSSVYHEGWVEVTEEGTEAAAATTTVGYSFGCSAPPPPPRVQFHADHPFLFFIVHNDSRSVLFAGWMMNPKGARQPPGPDGK